MNDWYIDRSKNFVNDSLIPSLKLFEQFKGIKIDSQTLVTEMTKANIPGIAAGNPLAALTRFRDHGLINDDNEVGDSTCDFIDGKLNLYELILDLFLKRPAKKSTSPNIKPFLIICKFFHNMIEMNLDYDDIFVTFSECVEYLYNCDTYEEVNFELVEKIIQDRQYDLKHKFSKNRMVLDTNQDTNLSIWFNALKETPVFMPQDENRNVLIPNLKQSEFFRFMSVNADEISATPTDNNKNLYNYYCNREKGLLEAIPKIIITTVKAISNEDVQVLYEYLFGFKKISKFDYYKYIKYDCFGIFFPFITVPKLAIRQISLSNSLIGEKLVDFVNSSKGYLESFDNGDFEYRGHAIEIIDSSVPIVEGGFNKIYYGVPGCGKSHKVTLDLKDIPIEQIKRLVFYPEYSYSEFVGQIKYTKSGVAFIPGIFTEILKMALRNPKKSYYLIIEELNRGNAPSIFGDLFQLLDRGPNGTSLYFINNIDLEDYLKIENIRIPSNLFLYATLNTSDQNVFTMDTAFKRRWNFENVPIDFSKCTWADKYLPNYNITWKDFTEKVNKKIVTNQTKHSSFDDKQIGPFFVTENELIDAGKFGYKVIEYLWNDVAKFDRKSWFTDATLEEAIASFLSGQLKIVGIIDNQQVIESNE